MNRVVLKFGGSSVKDIEHINKVADLIIEKKKKFPNVVVVVSAMGDFTDQLMAKACEIDKNPNRRELDQLLVTGEIISTSLLTIALEKKGHKAISLTGFQAGFKTYGSYGKSKIHEIDTKRIEGILKNDYIVVVAGFQGTNEFMDFTTLGRGGSDTSAVALAAKLNANCEIYTDVSGIYTVDPKIHNEAKKLNKISFKEAIEIASLGAKVINPRAVELAGKYNVPLYIALNTGDTLGTYITSEGDDMERNIISNVSALNDILLINLKMKKDERGMITKLFLKLAQKDINIDVISQSLLKDYIAISFTSFIDRKYDIEDILKSMEIDFEFIENVSKVSVIGNGMRNQSEVATRIFDVFLDNNIDFYQVLTSEMSISYIVDTPIVNKVVKLLAKEFNL